jgi:hypothetical protein
MMGTRTAKLLVAAAAAALSGSPFAQSGSRPASIDPEEQLRQQIALLQTETGLARPEALIEPLGALAMLQEEDGNHARAVATLEEARYVARIHNGLSSAEEALLLRQQVRNEKALGSDERAWDLEREMVTMARQHHDDIRMLQIFRDLVDERLGVIEQVRAGERPPLVYAGCYKSAPIPAYDYTREFAADFQSCIGGINQNLIAAIRAETLMYYADAIETLLRAGVSYASQELRQLERAALRLASGRGGAIQAAKPRDPLASPPSGSYAPCSGGTLDNYVSLEILDSCLAPVGRGNGWALANVGNQAALLRLVSYEVRSEAPPTALANAVAELADSFVLVAPPERRRFYRHAEVARTLYERAYAELERGGELQAATQMFASELPVTLPADKPNPFAPGAAESLRYIDVSFDVTIYGLADQIEVLDTSKDATREEKRDLIRLIESTSFRPRMVSGKIVEAAPVALRYRLP